MLNFVKILFVALMIVLIFVSVTIDTPLMQGFSQALTFSAYIRLASLLTLMVLVIWVWGHYRKLTSSQKYARAKEVIAEAENEAMRKSQAGEQLEERLKAGYVQKEQALAEQLKQVRQECQEQLKGLKKQNLQLKDTVAELMAALKKKNAKQ